MDWASVLVTIALLYAGVGLLFGVVFLIAGLARVDPVATGSPWGFRLLILPGVVGLWPLMGMRWWRAGREGDHDAA